MERTGRVDMLLALLGDNPKDPFLNYALGLEYASILRFSDAEFQFNKVMELDKNYIAVYYQLGKLSELQSKHTEALAYYKTGLTIARQKNDKSVHEFEEAIFMLED